MNAKSVLYGDVRLDQDGVLKKYVDQNGNVYWNKIAEPCTVLETCENLDTGNVSVLLEYLPTGLGAQNKQEKVEASVISSPSSIEKLASKGLDVNGSNKFNLIKHFRNERENSPIFYEHSKLGFDTLDGQPYFKHYHSIGLTDISTYVGGLKIKPMGDYQVWKSMVEREVMGNPALELALILGLSSALVGFIATDLGVESQFYHIYGDSSTGKSTACSLIASTFGSPNIREKGLVSSWNITWNALQGILASNYGVPMILEEASMAHVSDFTSVIYTLGEGKEKMRMNSDLEVREPRVWSTNVISNGEFSLFEKASPNKGLRIRLIEFANVQFTTSAENADAIKQCVNGNYGFAGPMFVEGLLQRGKSHVIKQFQYNKREALKKILKSPISARLASKIAFITTTTHIATKVFNLNFDIDGILDLFCEQVNRNITDGDMATSAYLLLKEWIVSNPSLFENKYTAKTRVQVDGNHSRLIDETRFHRYGGRVEFGGIGEDQLNRIIILPKTLEKFLESEGSYQSTRVILNEFKKRGWLLHDENHLTCKRSLNGISCRVHVIKANVADYFIQKLFGTSDDLDQQFLEFELDENTANVG